MSISSIVPHTDFGSSIGDSEGHPPSNEKPQSELYETAKQVVRRQLEFTEKIYKSLDGIHETSTGKEGTDLQDSDAILLEMGSIFMGEDKDLYESGIDTYDELFQQAHDFIEGKNTPASQAAAKHLVRREMDYWNYQMNDLYYARYSLNRDPIALIKELELQPAHGVNPRLEGLSDEEINEMRKADAEKFQETLETSITTALRKLNEATKVYSYLSKTLE